MADALGFLASASDYGGYGAADGYGYESSIDCNSALGLIGLLGLIELLRDIIDDITSTRRRRSADDGVFGFLLSSFGSAVGGLRASCRRCRRSSCRSCKAWWT
ncbi:hypothetical protein C7M84_015292 [Penaeus vannamei]|uniref:Uncharacterized protein n=1 Tax=Penaeus vannamei TaxID=6689 RepID=A0A423SR74_PENVA|nr:uncharacterized protein LOC113818525 [Penaeus vannamei]ROT66673.1 hypothetical protein C7M84_015292 [Penaeus vannamei]